MSTLLSGLATLLLIAPAGAAAEQVQQAEAQVARGEFGAAAETYRAAVEAGTDSADLFYNAGTAALKAGDLGQASLWLERAWRRAPDDPDIVFNLARARERVGGALGSAARLPRPGAWLLRWPTRHWQIVGLSLLTLALLLTALRALLGNGQALLRALLLGCSLPLLVAGLLAGWAAGGRAELAGRGDAVLLGQGEVAAREAPAATAPAVFPVHPGQPLQIVERRSDFVRAQLLNGLEGWLPATRVAEVEPGEGT